MFKLLRTTAGVIPEIFLKKSVLDESVPCGRAITTTWRLRGQVVKQDVTIIADKMPGTLTSIGGTA